MRRSYETRGSMKRNRTVLASIAAVLLGVATAHADSFSFSFGNAGTLYAGSGILTGNPNALGTYLITQISGTTVDRTIPGDPELSIISLVRVGTGIDHDNVLGVTGGYAFSSLGLSYELSDGTQVVLFGNSFEYLQAPGSSIVSEAAPITVEPVTAVTTTPEPGSLVLFGTGLLGLTGVVCRRFHLVRTSNLS